MKHASDFPLYSVEPFSSIREMLSIAARESGEKNAFRFSVGDTVQIIAGALEGFTGTVESIDVDNNVVKVVVSMFGRSTPAEVELSQAVLA